MSERTLRARSHPAPAASDAVAQEVAGQDVADGWSVIPPVALVRAEAEQTFNRFLAGWASDVLEVRRRGLDRFTWR